MELLVTALLTGAVTACVWAATNRFPPRFTS